MKKFLITESEREHILNMYKSSENKKYIFEEITKINGWEETKKRFTDTQGIDFKPLDRYYTGYEYSRSGLTTNYEYVVFLDLDNKAIELAIKSDGTFGVVHDDGDKNTPINEHMKGTWKWDVSKIVFSRNLSKNVKGLFTDADKDLYIAVYTDNKIGSVGARGPLVKKIQKFLISKFKSSVGQTPSKPIEFDDLDLVKTATRDYVGCMNDENKCDGIFGNGVKALLKKYQQDMAFMKVDGIWGKEMTDYAYDISGNKVYTDWK